MRRLEKLWWHSRVLRWGEKEPREIGESESEKKSREREREIGVCGWFTKIKLGDVDCCLTAVPRSLNGRTVVERERENKGFVRSACKKDKEQRGRCVSYRMEVLGGCKLVGRQRLRWFVVAGWCYDSVCGV